jgi:hypothetical protein
MGLPLYCGLGFNLISSFPSRQLIFPLVSLDKEISRLTIL